MTKSTHKPAALPSEAEILAQIQSQKALLRQVRLARGTQDMAPIQVVAEPAPSMRERIRAALLAESLSIAALARALGEPAGPVSDEMRRLRQGRNVANVGSEDFPLWTWRIGDDTDAPMLRAVVAKLISERPMTLRELVEATGARVGRVSGQVVEIQRSGANVMDLGNAVTSRWFLIPANARDARLPSKTEYRRAVRERAKSNPGS